jgi:hypothetical protein
VVYSWPSFLFHTFQVETTLTELDWNPGAGLHTKQSMEPRVYSLVLVIQAVLFLYLPCSILVLLSVLSYLLSVD